MEKNSNREREEQACKMSTVEEAAEKEKENEEKDKEEEEQEQRQNKRC